MKNPIFLDQKKRFAFSLIEIVFTLTIISSILGAAMFYFSKDQARARLDRTANQVLNVMLHAQSYASLQNIWTQICFIDNNDGNGAQIMTVAYPGITDPKHGYTVGNADPTVGGTFTTLKTSNFESGVTFCQGRSGSTDYCSGFTNWALYNTCMMITPEGYLQPHESSAEKKMWTSICIISEDIDNESQSAREIEFTQGGMIQLVPRGEQGKNTTEDDSMFSPVMSAGTAPCSNKILGN